MTTPTLDRQVLDSIVAIKTLIPDDAMSASLLGTERTGHGVRIREDGLIATIGYVIHEAETVLISTRDGTTAPGFVVGYDFDTGFGLVKPSMPLQGPVIELGESARLAVGDRVIAAGAGKDNVLETRIVAIQEFAGRWEYLLDEAIYTSPALDSSWSGAALLDRDGRLCGIGSLVIQGFPVGPSMQTVNMFVPIDLLTPIVGEICEFGRRKSPPRPWLGLLVHEDQDDGLTIVGVYRNCPADRAGLKPGDQILAVAGEPVGGLAEMFRRVWQIGPAGVEVPISVQRESETLAKIVASDDRAGFQRIGTVQ